MASREEDIVTLLSFGFDFDSINLALAQTSSLDGAIEWLFKRNTQSSLAVTSSSTSSSLSLSSSSSSSGSAFPPISDISSSDSATVASSPQPPPAVADASFAALDFSSLTGGLTGITPHTAPASRPRPTEEELKMVLVVRSDVGMSTGKVASQCVHAALGAYRVCQLLNPSLLEEWRSMGEKTVALRCSSETEMAQLQLQASTANIATYAVRDAGRTEVAAGCKTVLAIGPQRSDLIDSITGHLRLL